MEKIKLNLKLKTKSLKEKIENILISTIMEGIGILKEWGRSEECPVIVQSQKICIPPLQVWRGIVFPRGGEGFEEGI